MNFLTRSIVATGSLFALCHPASGLTVNADFSRDIVNGTNPGTNPEPVLYAGTGPAPNSGTIWNDLQIPLSATGDGGTNTMVHPMQFDDLSASDGTPTGIDIQLPFSRANTTASLKSEDAARLLKSARLVIPAARAASAQVHPPASFVSMISAFQSMRSP